MRAHGPAVGLPTEDDMGNSEVGHNALGAGRIFEQGCIFCEMNEMSIRVYFLFRTLFLQWPNGLCSVCSSGPSWLIQHWPLASFLVVLDFSTFRNVSQSAHST